MKSKLDVAHLSGDRQSEEKFTRLLQETALIRTAISEQISAHKIEAHAETGAAAAGADSGIEH